MLVSEDGVLRRAERAGSCFLFGWALRFWFGTGSWLAGDDGVECCWLTMLSAADLEMRFAGAPLSLPGELIGAWNPP